LANSYFQFKQFTIQQGNCAMKVCTDACLFGAWVAETIHQQKKTVQNILDIGSGTGLLSLMIAQKSNAVIDGVEIDKDAWLQSVENIQQSPFKNRVTITNTDVLSFQSSIKYDWIITNPPFFEHDLKSGNAQKNAAKHDTTLQLNQLVQIVAGFLKVDGFMAVLLPYHRMDDCIKAAEKLQLFVIHQILVKQTPKHQYFRCMLIFSCTKTTATAGELTIKNAENNYTAEFTRLLKDYYLQL
jgi:tRNA1Val (adenine37-N6)-methyltransferase